MTAAVGQPITRVDGPAKVTGNAKYAAEFAPEGLVYAALIESTIPAGTIKAMDSKAAEGAPGVLLVLTHRNAPKLPYLPAKERAAVEPVAGEALKVLQDTRILFSAQPIGIVLAGTQSQAEHAASLVRVEYELEPDPLTRFDSRQEQPASAAAEKKGRGPESRQGDGRRRFRSSLVQGGSNLHSAARTPQRDGAARYCGAMAVRYADPLGQDAIGLQRRG